MTNLNIALVDPTDENDAKIAFRLMKKWSKDYNRDDMRGAKRQTLKDVKLSCKHNPHKYLFVRDDETVVGIVAMKNFQCVDVIYILPEHRGKNYATITYKHLLESEFTHPVSGVTVSPVAIHIDIDRVLDRVHYWKELGFNYFTKVNCNLVEIIASSVNLAKQDSIHFGNLDSFSLSHHKNGY